MLFVTGSAIRCEHLFICLLFVHLSTFTVKRNWVMYSIYIRALRHYRPPSRPIVHSSVLRNLQVKPVSTFFQYMDVLGLSIIGWTRHWLCTFKNTILFFLWDVLGWNIFSSYLWWSLLQTHCEYNCICVCVYISKPTYIYIYIHITKHLQMWGCYNSTGCPMK